MSDDDYDKRRKKGEDIYGASRCESRYVIKKEGSRPKLTDAKTGKAPVLPRLSDEDMRYIDEEPDPAKKRRIVQFLMNMRGYPESEPEKKRKKPTRAKSARKTGKKVSVRYASQKFSHATAQELKAELDKHVVGQEEAKKTLTVAIANHYKRLDYVRKSDDDPVIEKSNILVLGPTGTGKTLMVETIARLLDVPFTAVDATTLTEAGYIGASVEDALARLLKNAKSDVSRAERGIVFIDEIDKIARRDIGGGERDISGEGVQQDLLRMLEGAQVDVPLEKKDGLPLQTLTVNTKNILFICGGAFAALTGAAKNENGFKVSREDLKKFGLTPELIGRLPVITATHALDEDALVDILTRPQNAIVRQKQALFEMDGVRLGFSPDGLKAIAKKAMGLGMGARSLRSIMEEILTPVSFDLPALVKKGVREVFFDAAAVRDAKSAFSPVPPRRKKHKP